MNILNTLVKNWRGNNIAHKVFYSRCFTGDIHFTDRAMVSKWQNDHIRVIHGFYDDMPALRVSILKDSEWVEVFAAFRVTFSWLIEKFEDGNWIKELTQN